MRFGIIGTGRITRRLVADLQSTDGVEVTAIASRSGERARWYAQQYGIAESCEGYRALLDRSDVDAVYISLPPSMHTEWSIRAAEAGKHLLCEKPLALTAGQVVQIDQACQTHSVRWLDATGWIHHQRTAAMKGHLDRGEIGTLGHLTAAVSFYRPFQSDDHRLDASLGGGCLLDLGWYTVGMLLQFAPHPPERVSADAVMEGDVPIRVNAMLWFPGRVTASFSCGYDTATRKWFEVAGSEASVICDDFTRPWADRATRYWVHRANGDVDSHEVSDRQEQRMIETLISDRPLRDYQIQALQTQAVLDAIALSIENSQPTPVSIPSFDAI